MKEKVYKPFFWPGVAGACILAYTGHPWWTFVACLFAFNTTLTIKRRR